MEPLNEPYCDPVCGVEVEPDECDFNTLYAGSMYYFCSLSCQLDFEEEPERYSAAHA